MRKAELREWNDSFRRTSYAWNSDSMSWRSLADRRAWTVNERSRRGRFVRQVISVSPDPDAPGTEVWQVCEGMLYGESPTVLRACGSKEEAELAAAAFGYGAVAEKPYHCGADSYEFDCRYLLEETPR